MTFETRIPEMKLVCTELALAAVCAVFASGCGDSQQAQHGAVEQGATNVDTCGGRGDDLDGLVVESDAGLTLEMVEIDPMPPTVGDNTWLVRLSDSDGEPIQGAEDGISVTPRMPDHGHGTPVEVGVKEKEDGVYQLDPVNTFMPGYWEVTVEVRSGEIEDSVLFGVCLP